MKRFPNTLIIVLILVILFGVLLRGFWENTALMLTEYTVRDKRIPTEFDGFRIAQVSDLHNTTFGDDNKELMDLLAQTQPDMIAITGDMVDRVRTDLGIAIAFAQEAVKIAPTYYTPGNHEAKVEEYPDLKSALIEAGVVVLENESQQFQKAQSNITVTGLIDPFFNLPMPNLSDETYQIVLSHRPELMDLYAQQGLELVLAGHAHGGQFRLPYVGGILAPHQGFFPKYDSGVFTQDSTTLVVSRGLGNSLFPFRLGNRPELILITLESV